MKVKITAKPKESVTIRPGDKLADVERFLIEMTLRAIPNKQDAADALGISIRTLYNRIEQYK